MVTESFQDGSESIDGQSSSPSVSVVIPVYNGERFLVEAIDSVLSQTFADFELIILDNCSTDSSFDIAKNYAEKDQRVRVIRNSENIGMVGNWNLAVLEATGDFIKLLCADDQIEPSHLQDFVEIFQSHPNVTLVTAIERFIGDSEVEKDPSYYPATGDIEGRWAQNHLLTHRNWVGCPSSVMFRRDSLRVGIFNMMWKDYLTDFDLWLRILSSGDLYVIPRVLTSIRLHQGQITNTKNIEFSFFKEEIDFLNTVFRFPEIYGYVDKREKSQAYKLAIRRLISRALATKKVGPIFSMLRIGMKSQSIRFITTLFKFPFNMIVNRIGKDE